MKSTTFIMSTVSALLFASAGFSIAANQVHASTPDCIKVETRITRGATGYNHIVKLVSSCKMAMSCKVTTNANKQGVTINVTAGGTAEANTFLNSPASAFEAAADCTPKP